MSDNVENQTIHLLQEMRADMKKRFDHVDEKTDELSVAIDELRKTQSAMLEFISSHNSHLIRIEADLKLLKTRANLIDA